MEEANNPLIHDYMARLAAAGGEREQVAEDLIAELMEVGLPDELVDIVVYLVEAGLSSLDMAVHLELLKTTKVGLNGYGVATHAT